MNPLEAFEGNTPSVGERVFIAETARIIGRVTLADDVNIWYGAVLRGDVGAIRIGARSNVQDLACLHMTDGVSNVEIGEDVTVGHGAIVHGAKVGDGALIGMGSLLLDNAEVGPEAVVAAGSLLTENMRVPPRTLVVGRPARVVRELSNDDRHRGRLGAAHYLDLVARYTQQR
jgi:carbonic anhydrase/acetyltransferase-like protein (isoleucine patch superfamily)